jgi:hypothetical protein
MASETDNRKKETTDDFISNFKERTVMCVRVCFFEDNDLMLVSSL